MADTLSLLAVPFLVCLLMTAVLSYLGLHVLKREIIFIDIAMAQVALVGAVVAHVCFGAHEGSWLGLALPVAFTLVAAVLCALARCAVAQLPLEAVIGIGYAAAAGAALLVIGLAPGGHVHVKHMLAGSILWAAGRDVWECVIVFSVAGVVFWCLRERFAQLSEGHGSRVAGSRSAVAWDALFLLLLGIVIVFSVRLGGLVLVFCLLIVPATTAALYASGWGARLVLAWAAGAAAALVGLLFARGFDFSPGPSVAMACGVVLVAAAVLRPWGGLRATGGLLSLLVVALLVRLAAVAPAQGVGGPRPFEPSQPMTSEAHGHEAHHHHGHEPEESPAGHGAPATPELRYEAAADAQARCGIVCEVLGRDVPRGGALLLRFLEGDPPFFFRSAAVEALRKALGERMGFDETAPLSAPANQAAAARLRKQLAELGKEGD